MSARDGVIQFSSAGAQTAGAKKATWINPTGKYLRITGVQAMLGTVNTGADFIVDVNAVAADSGTPATIYSTQANRPTITAGATTQRSSRIQPDTRVIRPNEGITYDVDQVGSTVAGSDLTVALSYHVL